MSTQTPSRVSLPTATWNVDPAHSQVEFRVKHVGIATFKGRFTAFDGVIRTEDDTVASVEGTVDVTSIRTNDERLDGHLQSPDFFDAENHPKITVKTTGPAEASGDGLRLRADLTIRGITKPVEFDVRIEGHGVDPVGQRAHRARRPRRDRPHRLEHHLEHAARERQPVPRRARHPRARRRGHPPGCLSAGEDDTTMTDRIVRVLAISGSLRRDSYNTAILNAAREIGAELNLELEPYEELATLPTSTRIGSPILRCRWPSFAGASPRRTPSSW